MQAGLCALGAVLAERAIEMLTIRREQLDAFSADLERRVMMDLLRDLRFHFPAEVRGKSDRELEADVIKWFEQAAGYGLLLERDLRRYVMIVVRLGETPGASQATAWAAEILRRDDEAGGYRLDQVEAAFGA